MSYPNTAPISRAEKGWGLVLAVLTAAVGLIVLIGLLLNQRWARWLGLVLAAAVFAAWVAATILLILNRESPGALNYPFYPWFIFLAALAAILSMFAARAFLAGLRRTDTDELDTAGTDPA